MIHITSPENFDLMAQCLIKSESQSNNRFNPTPLPAPECRSDKHAMRAVNTVTDFGLHVDDYVGVHADTRRHGRLTTFMSPGPKQTVVEMGMWKLALMQSNNSSSLTHLVYLNDSMCVCACVIVTPSLGSCIIKVLYTNSLKSQWILCPYDFGSLSDLFSDGFWDFSRSCVQGNNGLECPELVSVEYYEPMVRLIDLTYNNLSMLLHY